MNWLAKHFSINSTEWFLCLAFVGFSCFFMVSYSSLYVVLCTILCFLGVGYILSLCNLHSLYFSLALLLPFSIKTGLGNSGVDLFLPSEILIALLAIALVFRWLSKGFSDKLFFTHPISLLIILYLLSSGIGIFFSTMPLVSFKAFAVRVAYCIVFYFGIFEVFRGDPKSAMKLFLHYGFSILCISVYCLSIQSQFNWDKQTAAYSVFPFYSDHTIYSACAVFVLPALAVHFARSTKKWASKLFWGASLLVLLAGIYFTFCRAAWISLFLGLLFWGSIATKFKLKHYSLLLLLGMILVFVNKNNLLYSFKENRNVSTAPKTSALEQTQSITNVSTDVSNAERLNRWSCAWRMFLDHPVSGFGIGTFQFQYLNYQLTDETTYISVYSPYNIPKGRGGSTHNEYLLLLSESGIFAFVLFLTLIVGACRMALLFIYKNKEDTTRVTMTWLLLGFFTYLIHGFFNNFLDTDKAAFLFWTALSFMVGLQCAQKKAVNK